MDYQSQNFLLCRPPQGSPKNCFGMFTNLVSQLDVSVREQLAFIPRLIPNNCGFCGFTNRSYEFCYKA